MAYTSHFPLCRATFAVALSASMIAQQRGERRFCSRRPSAWFQESIQLDEHSGAPIRGCPHFLLQQYHAIFFLITCAPLGHKLNLCVDPADSWLQASFYMTMLFHLAKSPRAANCRLRSTAPYRIATAGFHDLAPEPYVHFSAYTAPHLSSFSLGEFSHGKLSKQRASFVFCFS